MYKIIILFIFVEIFEAYWQKADTLKATLGKSYHFYKKSIFLLLFMHLGYLYTIYISISLSLFNWAMMLIIALKTLDIMVKLNLIEKLFIKQDADPQLKLALEEKTPSWVYLTGVFTYPYLMYLSISMRY